MNRSLSPIFLIFITFITFITFSCSNKQNNNSKKDKIITDKHIQKNHSLTKTSQNKKLHKKSNKKTAQSSQISTMKALRTVYGSNKPMNIRRKNINIKQKQIQVSGQVNLTEVRAVIRAHQIEVQYCYKTGLKKNDKLQGVVSISFLINTSGRVKSCKVIENLSVELVGTCICKRLQVWKFPQSQGSMARVSYAWTFTPNQ